MGRVQAVHHQRAEHGVVEGDEQQIIEQLGDREINKRIGTDYLNAMLKRYRGDVDLSLAAYNQGPGIADKILGGASALAGIKQKEYNSIREAKNYARKVTS